MRQYRSTILLSVAAVFICEPPALYAWGPEGHAIVAEVAYQRLTVNARRGVRRLLGKTKLNEVGAWADDVRKQRSETGPWHYVDIQIRADDSSVGYKPDVDCPKGNCVIGKIHDFYTLLCDRTADRTARIEALKFLVHFVGDLHQPLHCAERPYQNHARDRGGNDVRVLYLDGKDPTNLHAVWDINIVVDLLAGQDQIVYAQNMARSLERDPLDKQVSTWQEPDTPEEWAAESHRLAIDHVYKGIPANQPRDVMPRLDKPYVEEGKRVAQEQLAKAGVRLADMLNQAFP